jgi:RecB family endonuclease NucS
MTVGPEDRDQVVLLPEGSRFTFGELRNTLCEIHSRTLLQLKAVMNDRSNWVGLITHFNLEKALQGYIADYPHRLEDGLLPYPDDKIWEKVFNDQSRLDVLLIDRDERPVVVECKRDAPSPADVSQLRRYMRSLVKETLRTRRKPRGILVHGGALKLSSAVRKEAAKQPRVEIVNYTLGVNFGICA